ncbi:redoxin domain-containing protein [Sphingomonas parva]|uniref:Redoxin domain-containing protein n=1 Tax=Sphingomonas parva TaxID=2555898 RepID=A0A4Y8ZU22_9SPHN|nr:SCO family protein [Sphingomonas parva]TFI59523.1 redoxin domain-containing protein [Sphingomonas parva]
MNETAKSRIFLILSLFLGVLAAACSDARQEPPLQGAAIGGPFTLTDQNGRQVRDSDFAGKYRIVYFGFANCPDVCPTDLAAIGQALRQFEKSDPALAAKVQPLFITVDPERDTPAALKQYVASFHPRLIGLTGSPQQIADAAKHYAVYYSKEPTPEGYRMNHARIIFLMGPKGEPIAMLPHDQTPDAIAAELERWVR